MRRRRKKGERESEGERGDEGRGKAAKGVVEKGKVYVEQQLFRQKGRRCGFFLELNMNDQGLGT